MTTEIIGRDDELASLYAFVDDVRQGPAAVVLEEIAFTRRTDHGDVAIMRSDGSEQTVLGGAVAAPFNDCCPSWQPRR